MVLGMARRIRSAPQHIVPSQLKSHHILWSDHPNPSKSTLAMFSHRCHSWRVSDHPHQVLCQPGTCFRCWRPCWNRLGSRCPNPGGPEWLDATLGRPRCRECAYLLAHHPLAWVRLALVSEGNPPASAVSILSEDGDFTVALTAQWQQRQQSAPTPPIDPFIERSTDAIHH